MRPIARLAASSCAVAVAIWLVPASIDIVSWPSSGPARVALLAPLVRLWIALAGAAAVTTAVVLGLRRRGVSLDALAAALAPLSILLVWLVPYLPWLADRAPLLLVLAGPLRWAVALAAVGVTVARVLALLRVRLVPPFTPGRLTVFVVSLAVYAALGLRFAGTVGFGGDEPHYLIITHSLLADRDLDIANNHAQRDYRSFFGGNLRPDFLRRGVHGEVYSIHGPGLPAVLLPAYAVGGALGAVVVMALLGALTALAIFDSGTAAAGPTAGTVTWLATAFTIPFIPHAWLIYPEMAGALVVAWAVLRWWRAPATPGTTMLYGLALAALPWLHTKFVIFLALFAAVELVRLWPRIRLMAAFAAPIATSGVAWLYAFYRMYGVADPQAPYGSYTRTFVLARNIPRGMLGLLLDQKFGLLVYAPVYVLALAGIALMLRDRRLRVFTVFTLAAALIYFVSSTRLYMWWGGASAPARFMVPIVPLLAPALAIAVARLRGEAGRALVVAGVALSLGIAVVTMASPHGSFLYSEPHGVAALAGAVQGSAPLDAAWPTFTEEDWRAPIALLVPWLIALAVASVVTIGAQRAGAVRTPFSVAACWIATFTAIGSFAFGLRAPENRALNVRRGQLALLHDFDPSRLQAVDVTHVRRLTDADVLRAATVTIQRSRDESPGDSRSFDRPLDLPEGRYEARVWFDGAAPHGEATVRLSNGVILGTRSTSFGNPAVVPFELPVGAPMFAGLAGATPTLVEIAPVSIVPRSARQVPPARVVEPVGGSVEGFIAYVDDFTLPEGGVFWTRGTHRGTVAVVTSGATTLRLVLHVGPPGGPVSIDVAGQRHDLDLAPDETREIDLPIAPGTSRVVVSVRAARSFTPAEVDASSEDRRSLGCQVRPQLY